MLSLISQQRTFLKALGFAMPWILTSSLGGLLTPTFSILREYTPKRDCKYPDGKKHIFIIYWTEMITKRHDNSILAEKYINTTTWENSTFSPFKKIKINEERKRKDTRIQQLYTVKSFKYLFFSALMKYDISIY